MLGVYSIALGLRRWIDLVKWARWLPHSAGRYSRFIVSSCHPLAPSLTEQIGLAVAHRGLRQRLIC